VIIAKSIQVPALTPHLVIGGRHLCGIMSKNFILGGVGSLSMLKSV